MKNSFENQNQKQHPIFLQKFRKKKGKRKKEKGKRKKEKCYCINWKTPDLH